MMLCMVLLLMAELETVTCTSLDLTVNLVMEELVFKINAFINYAKNGVRLNCIEEMETNLIVDLKEIKKVLVEHLPRKKNNFQQISHVKSRNTQ